MIDELRKLLETYPLYFYMVRGNGNHTDGFKLSIQGNTIEDVIYLAEHITPFLAESGISFKLGTKKLIDYTGDHPQQKHKLLTIYAPNEVPIREFAETIYQLMEDYTGGDSVKQPDSYTHYKNAIYYRNDRNENGEYIKANKK